MIIKAWQQRGEQRDGAPMKKQPGRSLQVAGRQAGRCRHITIHDNKYYPAAGGWLMVGHTRPHGTHAHPDSDR